MKTAVRLSVLLVALGLCTQGTTNATNMTKAPSLTNTTNAYPSCDTIDGQRCFQPGAHKSCQYPGDTVVFTCTCFGMWWTC
jgi:hypothetical protein